MSDEVPEEDRAADPRPELGPDDAIRAVVQRADCAANVVVLEVRVPGRTSLVIVGAPKSGGARAAAGLVSREARQAIWGARLPPASVRERPREDALFGSYVVALGESEALVEQRGDLRIVRAHGGRVVVTDETKATSREDFVAASDATRASWEARGLALLEALAADAIELHRQELVKLVDKGLGRVQRRREAIVADLGKIAQADVLASQAQWLVGEAARTPRGATKMVVTDWSSGAAVEMIIPLDPAKSAREQVEAMFKRAKRLRLGGKIAEERLAQAEAAANALEDAIVRIRAAEGIAAMDEAARDAKKAAPRDVTIPQSGTATTTGTTGKRRAAAGKPKRMPFRTFVGRSGKKLLVGKGGADNDELTLHVAKPHDLWLHAKDRTGAHVIVQLGKGQTCGAEDLVDAAHLAAHFSDAREESIVDVQYTPKRYLRKPKGSAAGFVVVDREKVLALRVDRAILTSLLEREEVLL